MKPDIFSENTPSAGTGKVYRGSDFCGTGTDFT